MDLFIWLVALPVNTIPVKDALKPTAVSFVYTQMTLHIPVKPALREIMLNQM